jgi:subtilisin family serine protease
MTTSSTRLGLPETLEDRRLLSGDGVSVAVPLQHNPGDGAAAYTVEWQGRRVHAVPGEFVFKLTTATAPQLASGWTARSLGSGTWLLNAPGASETQVTSWAASTKAAYIEPNYIFKPLATPVDPQYPAQWHLPRINAPAAWDTTTGSASVVIAVIDSGIDYDHPDFSTVGTLDRKNIWTNETERNGTPGVNDDNNVLTDPAINFVDDIFGWDFGNGDNNPLDDDPNPRNREDANIAELGTDGGLNKYTGHGTAVAGVMGAVANTTAPQQMVAGVAWDVKLMPLKITRSGFGYVLSAAVEAYKYIQLMKSQFNVNIVAANVSWGTYQNTPVIQSLREEIDKAGGLNVLTIAAAGDSGINIDATPFYPAAFDSDYVLSVAATNQNDTLWVGSPDYDWRDNVSNYGPINVDVAAPGKQILTTMARDVFGGPPRQTGNWEGSSMATGIVSGVAALMKAAAPFAPALSLKQVIINTVQKVAPLSGSILSGGIVDAAAAVAEIQLPQSPTVEITRVAGQENGVFEGDTGYTSANWQIRVRGPLSDPRTLYVDYRTDGTGSATPDGRINVNATTFQNRKPDYVPVVGTLAFLPGPRVLDRLSQVGRTAVDVGRTRSVPVRIFGDRNVEQSETMNLRIDRVYYKNRDGSIELANGFILTRTNLFTILNDDVAYNGTTAGNTVPTINFVGNTSPTGTGTGGTGTGSTGTGNAGNAGVTGTIVSAPEGNDGVTVMRFPLVLSTPTTSTVTVQYRTWDLSGRAGVDYIAKSGKLTFAPNVTRQFIDIPIVGNRIGQLNRNFLVEIFDPTNAIVGGTTTGGGTTGVGPVGPTAAGLILDDDALIRLPGSTVATTPSATVTLPIVSIAEPATGTAPLPVTLTLSQPVDREVTVRYQTRNMSAIAGQDYIATSGTLVFPRGASSATFNVTILADTFVEAAETFQVVFSSPTNATLLEPVLNCQINAAGGTTAGTGTTTTTTTPPAGTVTVTPSASNVTEGNSGNQSVTFTLRLAAASSAPVSVSFNTVNGTALAGRDFAARSGAVTFAPGETVKTVAVPILANTRVDGNRRFELVVTPTTGTRTPVRSGVTIVDDDAPAVRSLAFSMMSTNAPTTNPSSSRRSF